MVDRGSWRRRAVISIVYFHVPDKREWQAPVAVLASVAAHEPDGIWCAPGTLPSKFASRRGNGGDNISIRDQHVQEIWGPCRRRSIIIREIWTAGMKLWKRRTTPFDVVTFRFGFEEL